MSALHSDLQAAGSKRDWDFGMGFWNLKAYPSDALPPTRPHFPNHSKILPYPMTKHSKIWASGGHSHPNHHTFKRLRKPEDSSLVALHKPKSWNQILIFFSSVELVFCLRFSHHFLLFSSTTFWTFLIFPSALNSLSPPPALLNFNYLCMSAQSACMSACQERASHSITDGCELPCGFWELNSEPLEEQSVLLTAQLPL